MSMSPYREDLAFIHDDGFTRFAVGGAGVLVASLEGSGLRGGTILEFGCGSGVTAGILSDRGYSVAGFDLSESLLEMARQRAPRARFRVGTFVDVEMPECVAVCAIGEVLSYRFDRQNAPSARDAFFESAYRSLVDGGVLLFDVAGPDRALGTPVRTFHEGKDWAVLVDASAEAGTLTRRIVTFRRLGDLFRRDCEAHELELIAPELTESKLRAIGFQVERLSGYGEVPFPQGMHGFLARRPSRAAR